MADDEPTIVLRDKAPIVSDASGRLPPEIQVHYEGWLAACQRIWEATKDPLIIRAALRHTAFFSHQPIKPWLAAAADEAMIKGRTPAQERRYRERIVHMQRWSCVKALRAQGMTWDAIKEADRAAYNSYALVEANTQDGLNSEYWVLADTTRRPHLG